MHSRARLLACVLVAWAPAAGTQEGGPWRDDPLYQSIESRLRAVRAIDNHTHLLNTPGFNPKLDAFQPLGLRSTFAPYRRAVAELFGVSVDGADFAAAVKRADEIRATRLKEQGKRDYWYRHLDYVGTEIALVDQDLPDGTDGERLRWVPHATNLLYPLPAQALKARSSRHNSGIARIQGQLQGFLKQAGMTEPPKDLASYVAFARATLARWKDQGAVAVKFVDAYLRTLVFADVREERGRELYDRGRSTPLTREEYLALQDFLARQIFLEAGRLDLPVHIHSSHGVPPFLRTQEADVRNLDAVLTDERYFGTQFVLIHGGSPLIEDAAYLGIKPHVWIDFSALPFLYPVPELAQALRRYLVYAPQKVLFGTDVGNYPGVPVGPEVQHVAACRSAREALSLALAGLVRDRVVDLETALAMGDGVLRRNAERLYGWQAGR